MSSNNLSLAQARMTDCIASYGDGKLRQAPDGCFLLRSDSLNLADLGLTDVELNSMFVGETGQQVSFRQLAGLRYLDLTGNQLSALPEGIEAFKNVTWLGLNFNRLESVAGVEKLVALERLYLRGNILRTLPSGFGSLERLLELDLCDNQIVELPDSMLKLLGEERVAGALHLEMTGNGSDLGNLASAADYAADRRRALANYLREMRQDSRVLAQGKLLLVGEGGVGKTTLLDVLEGLEYNNRNDTTHGLELRRVAFQATEGWNGVLHAWDFSGQPAMRQTHQLFFTSPALYILVWNHREAREAETSQEIMEWLTLIDQRTQGEGRVLLVAKKAKDRSPEPPHFVEMLRRFGPESRDGRGGILLADPCLKVDSEGDQAQEQVKTLRGRIAAFAAGMPVFNERRPLSWIKAQQHFLEKRNAIPYVSWADFCPKCRDFGITDPEDYARAQHRSGTLVWLDTERLRHLDLADEEKSQQLVVLNPDWLSKAMGFVIERDVKDTQNVGKVVPVSPFVVATGLVSEVQMDAIWSTPPKPKNGVQLVFPPPLFPFFRQLMRAFDIARPVRHSGSLEGGWYLVPNRLQDSPPQAWDTTWRADLPQMYWRVELRGEQGEPLNHWLGLAIFYRLMIILHGDVQGRQDFAQAAHWRRGFMLAPPGGGLARIEFNGSDRRDASRCVGFDIQVAGHHPRDVWAVFGEALEHLVNDLELHYGYAGICVMRLVSCPAGQCPRDAGQRYYIEEQKIALRAHSGDAEWKQKTTICGAPSCGKDIAMGLLWDGRLSDDKGRLERMEETLKQTHLATLDTKREVIRNRQTIEVVRADLADIQVRLQAQALASTEGVERILNGQARLSQGLRQDMERIAEHLMAELRDLHLQLHDPNSDLPTFYSLAPVGGWRWPLAQKKWRLWLHCEKTGYPPALLRNDRHGEFIIPESQAFLKLVAPYVSRVATVLAALGPVTALLTNANPVAVMTPGIVLALAQLAKDFEKPVGGLATMLKEESATGFGGMSETGDWPVRADHEGLLWLHNFLRSDVNHRNKLGLVPKVDGQGRRWWVLPDAEV